MPEHEYPMPCVKEREFIGIQCEECGDYCPFCFLEDGEIIYSNECQGGHCEHMDGPEGDA